MNSQHEELVSTDKSEHIRRWRDARGILSLLGLIGDSLIGRRLSMKYLNMVSLRYTVYDALFHSEQRPTGSCDRV